MNSPNTTILFRKKRLQPYRGRGQLYSWLRAHREKIAAGLASGEYTWPILCAECSRHGIVSRDGAPPSRKAAQKAWQTLLRDLQTLGVGPAEKMAKPIYPSRTPKGWVPPGIAAAMAAGNPAVEGVRPSSISGANGPVASPERGLAVRSSVPPPPIPPAKPTPGEPLSRYARPDDSPEVKAAYASIEAQLDKADWYLMAGKPRKRRTE